MLSSLLGENYFYYGYNVFLFFINKRSADPSPLIFPRFTMCNLMQHAFTGDLTVTESYCRLTLYLKMSFLENICPLLLFKNVTVCQIIPSCLDLVILHCSFELFLLIILIFMINPHVRGTMVSIGTSHSMKNMINLSKKLSYNEWFIIYMIKRNTESIIFENFITELIEVMGEN